jgi:hypothetical protein
MPRLIVDGVVEKMALDGTAESSFHVMVKNEQTGGEILVGVSPADVGRLAELSQQMPTMEDLGYTEVPEAVEPVVPEPSTAEPLLPWSRTDEPEPTYVESDDDGEVHQL